MRTFISKFGRDGALLHMEKGDRYVPERLMLREGLEEVHVVGGFPRGISPSDLRGAKIVWHDSISNRGSCDAPCRFIGSTPGEIQEAVGG